jgi:hypothetical protein
MRRVDLSWLSCNSALWANRVLIGVAVFPKRKYPPNTNRFTFSIAR